MSSGPRALKVVLLTTFGTDDRTPGLERLTAREHEVFLLMATGFSNTEIGEQLYVGEQTVKTHVSRVLAKLGLRDRVHAVRFAHHHGLIEPHDESGL